MDWRVRRINEVVKQHDPRLFAQASGDKVIVLRQGDRLEASDSHQSAPDIARLNPQFILALTDNWKVTGNPVEWGLEPLMHQLRSMDSWSDPDMYRNMVKKREREQSDQERAKRNDLRARAADLRADFARATNDINTATLEKVERRRLKDGDC